MTGTPLTPAVDWDAVRATPEGAALADAYLSLREALQLVIVFAQGADTGKGMTPAALRTHAEGLMPLLDEPNGKRWTADYYRATSFARFGAGKIRDYLADVQRGYRHDWQLEDVLADFHKVTHD